MADVNGMSIADLEKLINSRKSVLSQLYIRRDQLTKQLDAINAEIAAAEGVDGSSVRGRMTSGNGVSSAPKRKMSTASVTRSLNDKSLKAYVAEALNANRKGLTLSEIQDAVIQLGYVTNSSNFKNTLYLCLYHNADLFVLDKKTKTYKPGKEILR